MKKTIKTGFVMMIAFVMLLTAACSSQQSTNQTAEEPTGKSEEQNENVAEFKIPDIISMTSYDVGSTGYIQAEGIGAALKKSEGVTLRSIPSGTDVARLSPVRNGQIPFAMTGAGAWVAQEGLYEFGSMEWGPQPVRLVWMGFANTGVTLVVTEKSGMKTPYDLKGKRVAYVAGAPAINAPTEAVLAFGNLTWDDVQRVDFPSNSAALSGLTDGLTDAVYAFNDTQFFIEQSSRPEGAYSLRLPADDQEGWARLQKIWPVLGPTKATEGIGASPENPIELGIYAYPLLVSYEQQDPDLVYTMSKLLGDNYDNYKDAHPGLKGWSIDRQIVKYEVPWHEGTIRYFKELGLWDDEAQQHHDRLVQRQQILIEGFQNAVAEAADQKLSSGDFESFWMAKREEILHSLN